MRGTSLQRYRNASWKAWLGAALAVWLLAAEAFAVAHQYDAKGHANGQTCAVCVSAASFGAGNVAAPVLFEPVRTVTAVAVAAASVFLSAAPARRFARGPPIVSFTF